jgi:hypothetical protein
VNGTCIRSAWLSLPDGRTIGLEGQGYWCTKLDLGSPVVREVVNNRPDNTGTIDQTRYMGSRVVSADITTLSTAGGRIDEVASAFGPFMDPSARPTLHYVLDRADNPERAVVLRGSAYSWPIAGPIERDIQLQWVAPDPMALDPTEQVATSWADPGRPGRAYDLVFPRAYPSGGGGALTARVITVGDVPVRPTLRIFGPITGTIRVRFQPDSGGPFAGWPQVIFLSTFSVNAGHYVSVDCDAHTAFMDDDPTQSVLSSVDWYNTVWPVLQPGDAYTLTLTGNGAVVSTQVAASWHDRYFA